MNPLSEFMSSRPGETIRLKPDWFVVTGRGSCAARGRARRGCIPPSRQKVKVFIDHETPCGSEKSADLQRLLIEYAGENGCELFNGYGVSYQLMLDKYVQPGQLVACCGKFGSIFASAGAFAVSLTAEEMKSAVESGEIEVAVPGNLHAEGDRRAAWARKRQGRRPGGAADARRREGQDAAG